MHSEGYCGCHVCLSSLSVTLHLTSQSTIALQTPPRISHRIKVEKYVGFSVSYGIKHELKANMRITKRSIMDALDVTKKELTTPVILQRMPMTQLARGS